MLVAVLIAVMALSALYRLGSTGLATETVSSRYSRALLIAQSALEDIGVETPLVPGTATRTIDDVYQEEVDIQGRPELLRGEVTAAAPYPYEIRVKVLWHEGKRARTLDLSTIRLGPAP
jgi:general secretion pathway protein I